MRRGDLHNEPAKPVDKLSQDIDLAKYLGILITGFIGALNFVGLKSDEIASVLRNESVAPSVVALVLLLAIMASVAATIQSGSNREITMRSFLASALCALAGALAFVASTPIPRTTSRSETYATWFLCGLTCIAGIWVARGKHRRNPLRMGATRKAIFGFGNMISLQHALLVMAVILTSMAVYFSLRLETASQVGTSSPGLSGIITSNGGDGMSTLALAVTGDRLRNSDHIAVQVFGISRTADLDSACKDVPYNSNPPCKDGPCDYLIRPGDLRSFFRWLVLALAGRKR